MRVKLLFVSAMETEMSQGTLEDAVLSRAGEDPGPICSSSHSHICMFF